MDKFNTYFGQIVTDNDLNTILNELMGSIQSFVQDFGYSGIAVGADVVPNAAPNLTVGISAPGVVYDQLGNRILFGSQLNVNCSIDENNQNTAVTNSGNAKWISVFIKFKRTPTDPRVNDLGEQVYFREVSGYEVHVAQAAEASASVALRPALRGDEILLADIKLTSGKSSIVAGDIDFSRRQVIYNLPGAPLAIQSKGLRGVLVAMLGLINSFGPDTIQIPAINGNPNSTAGGTLASVLATLLNLINQNAANTSGIGGRPFAYTNADQIFTGINTFGIEILKGWIDIQGTDPTKAAIVSFQSPSEAVNTTWNLMFSFKFGGGHHIRFYVGSDGDTNGAFAITMNAAWQFIQTPGIATGSTTPRWMWKQQVDAKQSTALIWQFQRLRIVTVDAGPRDPFDNWPNNFPDGGANGATGLQVDRGLNVTGQSRQENVQVTGQLTGAVEGSSNRLQIKGAVTVEKSLQALALIGTSYIRTDTSDTGSSIESGGTVIAGTQLKGKSLLVTEDAKTKTFESTDTTIVKGLRADDDSTFNGNIRLKNTKAILYDAEKLITADLNIAEAKSNDWGFIMSGPMYWASTLANALLAFPLNIPVGARLLGVSVLQQQPSTKAAQFSIVRLLSPNTTEPSQLPIDQLVLGTSDIADRPANSGDAYWNDCLSQSQYQENNGNGSFTYMLVVATPSTFTASDPYKIFRVRLKYYARGIGR